MSVWVVSKHVEFELLPRYQLLYSHITQRGVLSKYPIHFYKGLKNQGKGGAGVGGLWH
jgi:hypothetical protein